MATLRKVSIWIAVLSLLVCLLCVSPWAVEKFIGTRYLCPTRNMSLDLRGDVYVSRAEGVWDNSEIGPMNPDLCSRVQEKDPHAIALLDFETLRS